MCITQAWLRHHLTGLKYSLHCNPYRKSSRHYVYRCDRISQIKIRPFGRAKAIPNSQPLPFTHDHCKPARVLLGWSVNALAFRLRVSPSAIRREEERAELRRVTMQALAYAMALEGLVFFPSHPPMRAHNCRGASPDPRTREDYTCMGSLRSPHPPELVDPGRI